MGLLLDVQQFNKELYKKNVIKIYSITCIFRTDLQIIFSLLVEAH